MPPLVLNPSHNGSTQGSSYNFNPTNAHGLHPATSIVGWKLTVTTQQSNGGTLKTETPWSTTTPIAACPVNNLPADDKYYWTQIIYATSNGGTLVSTSNKFQSRR